MKNIFSRSLSLLALFLLVGCSGGNDYRNALPEQSAAVVSLDLPRLSARIALESDKGQQAMKRMQEMVKSGLEGTGQLVDRIFADPSETGIDIREKIYMFSSHEMSTLGLLAKVSDASRLETLIEVLHKQQLCQSVRETDGCLWTVLGKWLIAYSDDALLVLKDNKWADPQKLVRQASMWLRQQEGQGFAAKADFNTLQSKASDLVVWSSLQLFPRQVLTPLTMGLSAELDTKHINALTTVDFEAGHVHVDIHPLVTDPVLKGLIDRKKETMAPIKGSHLDLFPSKTPFWTTANLKGKEFYAFLREIPVIRTYLEHTDLPIALDYGRIFDAINGDVSVAVTDSQRGDFIIQAEVSQTEFLSVFTELRPLIAQTNGMMLFEQQGDNAYYFATRNGSLLNLRPDPKQCWLGVKGNTFYLTNKQELIDQHILGLTLRDQKWGGRVPGKQFFAAAKWDGLRAFEYLMQKDLLSAVPKMLSGMLDYVTVESADEGPIHVELIQKDSKRNLFQVLLFQ